MSKFKAGDKVKYSFREGEYLIGTITKVYNSGMYNVFYKGFEDNGERYEFDDIDREERLTLLTPLELELL